MEASANPQADHDVGGGAGVSGNPGKGSPAAVGTETGLKHNPGLAVEWSLEEQAILEDGLARYASESTIVRYAKIAMQLQEKTVRDVALRCRWMNKKESGKRRKEDQNLTRKNKDNKKKAVDTSAKHLAARPCASSYSMPIITMDNDDDISYKDIGGAAGRLLEHNAEVLSQISANLTNYLIQENIGLLCQTRDNILTILNDLNDMPAIMKQMRPLPVKVNKKLANSILPRTSLPRQS